MDEDRWSSDLNLLCEQLSTRLAADGATHPEAAALAIAVRGLDRSGQQQFADDLGMPRSELRSIEAGDVAFDDLPPAIIARAAADERLDLDRLSPAGDGPAQPT